MVAGCNPQCASFPCHNNAECVEHWSGYTCKCENSYAHSGDNCEISEYDNNLKDCSRGKTATYFS